MKEKRKEGKSTGRRRRRRLVCKKSRGREVKRTREVGRKMKAREKNATRAIKPANQRSLG